MKVKGMRIGDLAKRTGVSTATIRFYEARGLLPAAARAANGYRDYDDHAVQIVTFIDRARRLGFSLREVGAHLRSPRDAGRKARLQAQLELKLAELDAHMEQVRARRAILAGLIEEIASARSDPEKPDRSLERARR
ncbi:MerR family transcriptional regulator [Roseiarcus fermentans]|nr:MerR family transcriptional regulator [Roseiarcus fermentans]